MNVPSIPENSLKEKIQKIVHVCRRLQEDFGEAAFEFNEPATTADIELWEKENKITIPASYKEWLNFSNGSDIQGTYMFFRWMFRKFFFNLESMLQCRYDRLFQALYLNRQFLIFLF